MKLMSYYLQDVFDLPLHMARDQIEESLRAKMASIKVFTYLYFRSSLIISSYAYSIVHV